MTALRVFITGASSGLGLALARQYAMRGAQLGLLSRRQAELKAVADGLSTACAIYAADVRDAGAVASAAADFTERYGAPDVVLANAGISIGTTVIGTDDLEVVSDVIGTNVLGVANTVHAFSASMREAGAGKIVGIASVAGYRGLAGAGAYSASKAAVIAYVESARVELAPAGVQAITVCPGYIGTPMTEANPYRMPFLLSADEAAARVIRIIESGRSYAVIPWQMAIVARALRMLPNALYDRIFARAPRKPRRASSTRR